MWAIHFQESSQCIPAQAPVGFAWISGKGSSPRGWLGTEQALQGKITVPRLPELKECLDNQAQGGLLSFAGLGVGLDVLMGPFHLRLFYNSMNKDKARGGTGRVMLNPVPCQPSLCVLLGSLWGKIPNSQCFCQGWCSVGLHMVERGGQSWVHGCWTLELSPSLW